MFVEIPTMERGSIMVNANNVTHVFKQGDNVFFELIGRGEYQLYTDTMTYDKLMLILGGAG